MLTFVSHSLLRMISVGGNTRALMLGTNLPHMKKNTYSLGLRSALEQVKKNNTNDIGSTCRILDLCLTSYALITT